MRLRLFGLLALFLADRALKHFIWYAVPPDTEALFFNPLLNTGISFSIPAAHFLQSAFIPLLVLIILWVSYQATKEYSHGHATFFWWGMIVIGALSNLFDRFQLGGVLDYIDFKFFPVFNISDAYIFFGVVMLIIKEVFFHGAKKT